MSRIAITYNEFDGGAAAALVLLRWPETSLRISSTGYLARTLGSIEAGQGDEVHVLGFGVGCPLDQLEQALTRLRSAEAKVVWYLPSHVRGDEAFLAKHCDAVVGRWKSVAKLVAHHLGLKSRQAETLVKLAAAKKQADDLLCELFDAAVTRYFKFQDYDAVPNAIRKLANPSLIDDLDRAEIARYHRLGPRRLTGRSPAIRELRDKIKKVAADPYCRVLITGETGTGKETVARLIHEASPRRDGPFFAVSCANFDENLFESHLFGHEKGAFTGAHQRHAGVFERASGGTVFLDEVVEMSTRVQAKLLRVLQENTFNRVGGTDEIRVDVRVITATNRDLVEEIRQGRFRRDLYYRINGIPIHTPPLRERPEDIPYVAGEILYSLAARKGIDMPKLTKRQVQVLQSHSWPGNVRELENVLERAIVLEESDLSKLIESGAPLVASPDERILPLDERLRDYVKEVYERLDRNVTHTAQTLGISPNTVKKHLRHPA